MDRRGRCSRTGTVPGYRVRPHDSAPQEPRLPSAVARRGRVDAGNAAQRRGVSPPRAGAHRLALPRRARGDGGAGADGAAVAAVRGRGRPDRPQVGAGVRERRRGAGAAQPGRRHLDRRAGLRVHPCRRVRRRVRHDVRPDRRGRRDRPDRPAAAARRGGLAERRAAVRGRPRRPGRGRRHVCGVARPSVRRRRRHLPLLARRRARDPRPLPGGADALGRHALGGRPRGRAMAVAATVPARQPVARRRVERRADVAAPHRGREGSGRLPGGCRNRPRAVFRRRAGRLGRGALDAAPHPGARRRQRRRLGGCGCVSRARVRRDAAPARRRRRHHGVRRPALGCRGRGVPDLDHARQAPGARCERGLVPVRLALGRRPADRRLPALDDRHPRHAPRRRRAPRRPRGARHGGAFATTPAPVRQPAPVARRV